MLVLLTQLLTTLHPCFRRREFTCTLALILRNFVRILFYSFYYCINYLLTFGWSQSRMSINPSFRRLHYHLCHTYVHVYWALTNPLNFFCWWEPESSGLLGCLSFLYWGTLKLRLDIFGTLFRIIVNSGLYIAPVAQKSPLYITAPFMIAATTYTHALKLPQ